MSRYIAALILALHRGESLQELTKPAKRIKQMITLYQNKG